MPVIDVAVVSVGPGAVRSLRSGIDRSAPDDLVEAVLGGIDDTIVLVDDEPTPVAAVWREALADLIGGPAALIVVVLPSWWSARRVSVIVDAARAVATEVLTWSRAQALAAASVGGASVVVEIADSLVAVSRPCAEHDVRPDVAIPRDDASPVEVAEAVAEAVGSLRRGWAPVVIDRAEGVAGAAELAAMLAKALPGIAVTTLGDDRALQAVADLNRREDREDVVTSVPADPGRRRTKRVALAAGIASAVAVCALATGQGGSPAPPTSAALLTDGRVGVMVPVTWTAYRVTGDLGSPRVSVASPADPEAAVHITQSAAGRDETLEFTAEALRRALDDEAPGVFVDFRPADRRANRPAVTYREVRARHHVLWAVLLDGRTRIGIGCQSAPGRDEVVREPCEQAVASAREMTGTAGAH